MVFKPIFSPAVGHRRPTREEMAFSAPAEGFITQLLPLGEELARTVQRQDHQTKSETHANGTRAKKSLPEGTFAPSWDSLSQFSQKALQLASTILASGQLVAIPTETVYGLAADARSQQALDRVYLAKNRPADNPLIVHVSSLQMLREHITLLRSQNGQGDNQSAITAKPPPPLWSPSCEALMAAFWPGPLTLLFDAGANTTVAVRMPSHAAALSLIEVCGFPLAAPSANMSGRPSPTEAAHVLDELGSRIPLVLDGGACAEGLESTVISCLEEPPILLRPGTITLEALCAVLDAPVTVDPTCYDGAFAGASRAEQPPRAPGMKYRHYSPNAEVHLVHSRNSLKSHLAGLLANLQLASKVGILSTSGVRLFPVKSDNRVVEYSVSAENSARELFRAVRWLDKQPGVKLIIIEGLPETGLGQAFMNRARKAASLIL